MSIAILQHYIIICLENDIEPTFEGLKKFQKDINKFK